MNLLKSITTAIFTLISLTVIGILIKNNIMLSMGHLFLLPLVGFWYGTKRQWSASYIDKLAYATFALGAFADSVILIDWGQTGEFLSISVSLIMNLLIIMIFRKEGTRIYSDKTKDIPKIVVPALSVFLFFGYFMIPSLPTSIYFLSIFYAVLEVIFVAHGLFREAKRTSYLWIAFGVVLFLLKDVIYGVHFFVYSGTKPFLYAIQYSLNIFSFFMIAIGIAINQENTEKTKSETLLEYLRNYLKKFSKVRYAKHSHKYLFNRREDSQQTQLN